MEKSTWIEFDRHAPEKKSRASLTCSNCHSKKVKCDLQVRMGRGFQACSKCNSASVPCRPRRGKRDRSRMLHSNGGNTAELGRTNEPSTSQFHQPVSVSCSESIQDLNSWQYPTPSRAEPTSDASTVVMTSSDVAGNESAAVAGIPDKFGSAASGNSSVDTGFLHVYQVEHETIARKQTNSISKHSPPIEAIEIDLQESFRETYFTYCYAYCPVLDKSPSIAIVKQSALLDTAVALTGSNIRPPLIPSTGPATYYDRARRMFYEDEEPSLIASLQALCLFYWYSPKTPATVHRHSSWWWTSAIIRHCQQAGFHRESARDRQRRTPERGLRRRIFWTAFARERLTAMCQGNPCIIDPEDCNLPPVSLEDFPVDIVEPQKTRAEVFIHWVKLCCIIGRIAKYLSRYSESTSPAFPVHLVEELSEWSSSLPTHLQLPIDSQSTSNFNFYTHQMHLPYLAVIIVLYMKRSTQFTVPTASPPAIIAASCVARILKDLLLRGEMRGLMPITCWYCGMAFMPLLQAANTVELGTHALAELEILKAAIKQLKVMWDTANLFEQGFERLTTTFITSRTRVTVEDSTHTSQALPFAEKSLQEAFDYKRLFPFVTAQTSSVCSGVFAQEVTQFSYFASSENEPVMNFGNALDDMSFWLDFDNNFPFQAMDMEQNQDIDRLLS